MHLSCMNVCSEAAPEQRSPSQPLVLAYRPRRHSSDPFLVDDSSTSTQSSEEGGGVKLPTVYAQPTDMVGFREAMRVTRADARQGPSKSFAGMGDVARTFQSRLRRASTSLKASLQSSSSRSRTTQDSWVETSKPLLHRRRTSEVAQKSTPMNSFDTQTRRRLSHSFDSPEALADQTPGAAARAWAAKENERLGVSRRDSNQANVQTTTGRESGINLSLEGLSLEDSTNSRESQMCRKDPFTILPAEIQTHILSFLDAASLSRVAQVSRQWHSAGSDEAIWREAFLRQYNRRTFTARLPMPVGGRGIGKDYSLKEDNWKKMYKARRHLDRNWKNAKATAVYLSGHSDSVYCVQFDENKIVTGSRDRTIRFWDINTYKCTQVIGHSTMIARDTEYARSAPQELAGGIGLSILPNPLSKTPDPAIYHVPSDFHKASILCLQYDSEIMVTGSSDHTLMIWDVVTRQPIRRLKHHTSGVLDVAFDEEKIVSCSKDTTICIWDRQTGALLQQLSGHRGPVNALQLRGNLVVSASGEGCAKLWNLNLKRTVKGTLTCNAKCVKEFWSADRGLACVEFSDDCRYILAGGNDQVVYKFNTQTGEAVASFEGHTSLVRSLYLDGSNGRVVSGSYDMSLRVWDYETGKTRMNLPNWTTSWMLSAKSDYRRIVSTSQDGRVLIMDFGADVEGIELLEGSEW